jgi:hypothetical protein
MQKILKKYGVIILFYIVVIGGVLLLNTRLRYLNSKNNSNSIQIVALNK